jgi:hypothetical protein
MPKLIKLFLSISLAGVLVIILIACGGGGSNDAAITPTTQATDTVGILLTDKPADPSLFQAMNATIEQVALIGLGEGDEVSLYSDEPRTIDLLSLKNTSIPFTFRALAPTVRFV